MLRLKRWPLLSILFLGVISCTSSEQIELQRGQKAQTAKDYPEAVFHFERVLARTENKNTALDVARELAKIYHVQLKKFPEAIKSYKYIVLNSGSIEERFTAQKNIASLYFDYLNNYSQSIVEFNRLLEMKISPSEDVAHYRLAIARSYYYLNQFYQSETEVEEILKETVSNDLRFDVLTLKANLYLAQNQINKAVKLLNLIVDEYPQKSIQENTILNLVMVYEEKKEFDKAIEILKEFKSKSNAKEYIELRIKKLKARKKNLPGAKGLRR